MRVLIVAHLFPRSPDDPVGAFQWHLAEALLDRGHAVRVIAGARRGPPASPLVGSVEVRWVPWAGAPPEGDRDIGPWEAPRGLIATARAFPLVRALAHAITDECAAGSVHLVHAHGLTGGGAAALAKRHGRPLVLTLHPADVRSARRWFGRRVLRSAGRRASVITVAASYLADAVAPVLAVPPSALPVSPMPLMGIELPAAPPMGIPHGAVFAGPLTREMGVHVLLDALALLRKGGLPLDLTVVGDGPERAALKAQARALGTPAVFTGWVPPGQVADHLAGKRVFVLPAIAAVEGHVVAEALAHSVPVVATALGGALDQITEDAAGALVPPGDAAALAAAIRTVVGDDAYLIGALNAGRGLLARRSPAAVAAALEQVYLDARGRRASGARLSGPGARSSRPNRLEPRGEAAPAPPFPGPDGLPDLQRPT